MKYFNEQIETADRDTIREIQLQRLKKQVRFTYDNVPHYRKKLDGAGFSPDDIKTLEDIRHIPFSTKTDMRDNYPYGLFAVPMKKIVRIHASSGTTG
ncbi:MAG: phenylacetate--CoA ligase, partial [Firmicutes bacterium]|nr:phenylacetate--CoA ligase [Bacillota bacterium]